MAKVEVCDLCDRKILEYFSDVSYRITKNGHGYDGYMPFRTKWKVDVCPDCLRRIIGALRKKQLLENQ